MNADRTEALRQCVDEFELLVDAGKVEWVDVDFDALPSSTMAYVGQFLCEVNVSFQVARLTPLGSYFFKLDDPLVGYLHHDPIENTHVWICKNFKFGLSNQAVFNYWTARKVACGIYPMETVNKYQQFLKDRDLEGLDG